MEKYKPIWNFNEKHVTFVKRPALYDGALSYFEIYFLDNGEVGSRPVI